MKITKKHHADQVLDIINRVYYNHLTTVSGGNISMMDDDGNIFITPSSIDKGSLRREDIMKVTPDGQIIGPHKPSCELPFHSNVYRLRPDIKAIVHAHPPALVAYAITRNIPLTNLTSHTKAACSNISTSTYAIPGSKELGDIISKEFAKGYDLIMMDAHGAVVGAKDLETAFALFEELDYCARMQINAASIGLVDEINGKHAEKKPYEFGFFAPEKPTNEEIDLRADICRFLKRAYGQNMVNASFGTLSKRLGDDEFIINPHKADRANLEPDDIVKVKGGKAESGKIPAREADLHRHIYKTHPEVEAVFMSEPPYAATFAITESKPFDSRLIPESYIMLHDVKKLPYTAMGDYKEISDVIGKQVPVVLVENEGAIAVGNSLMQVFDRMEVLEYSANSVLSAYRMGTKISPMTDAEVAEVNDNFKIW